MMKLDYHLPLEMILHTPHTSGLYLEMDSDIVYLGFYFECNVTVVQEMTDYVFLHSFRRGFYFDSFRHLYND